MTVQHMPSKASAPGVEFCSRPSNLCELEHIHQFLSVVIGEEGDGLFAGGSGSILVSFLKEGTVAGRL